jgi:hypothetical protein
MSRRKSTPTAKTPPAAKDSLDALVAASQSETQPEQYTMSTQADSFPMDSAQADGFPMDDLSGVGESMDADPSGSAASGGRRRKRAGSRKKTGGRKRSKSRRSKSRTKK